MAHIQMMKFLLTEDDLIQHVLKRVESKIFDCRQVNDSVKLLFFIELDAIGENRKLNDFLRTQMNRQVSPIFSGAHVALIVYSKSQLYTKTFIRKFIFLANQMGAEFIGHPAVEILGDLQNFRIRARAEKRSLLTVCEDQLDSLIDRLHGYRPIEKERLNILALHAGHYEVSNSLMLWTEVKSKLERGLFGRVKIDEVHVEEGKITDCYGCSFETCMYYAMEKSCFYGGVIIEEIYRKLEEADLVIWVCPNYNDAISAKLMAVINRLTALYRNISFRDKYMMAIIVSANSGNDAVASQLVGALNVNKGFRLLPQFALMAHGNEAGEVMTFPDVHIKVDDYVDGIVDYFEKKDNSIK